MVLESVRKINMKTVINWKLTLSNAIGRDNRSIVCCPPVFELVTLPIEDDDGNGFEDDAIEIEVFTVDCCCCIKILSLSGGKMPGGSMATS